MRAWKTSPHCHHMPRRLTKRRPTFMGRFRSFLISNIRFLTPDAVSKHVVVMPNLGEQKQHVLPVTVTGAVQATPGVVKPRAGGAVVGRMPQWVTGRRLYVILLTLATFVLGMFVGESDHRILATERYGCRLVTRTIASRSCRCYTHSLACNIQQARHRMATSRSYVCTLRAGRFVVLGMAD